MCGSEETGLLFLSSCQRNLSAPERLKIEVRKDVVCSGPKEEHMLFSISSFTRKLEPPSPNTPHWCFLLSPNLHVHNNGQAILFHAMVKSHPYLALWQFRGD